jgi:zinc transport system ATP-binding protein
MRTQPTGIQQSPPRRDDAPDDKTMLVGAQGVCVNFGGRAVLDEVDLQVAAGEIVTLIGLNGSGKSTLLHVLLGLLEPDRGIVTRAPGLRVGYVPQYVHRDPTLPITVERFLTLGIRASRVQLQKLLDEVGAGRVLDTQLADISGGEFHRVLLARAMLREPQLLVLDEPLAGVDVASQSELYRLIASLRDRYGCGVLLVSHELHVVMAATDRVVCLNHHVCCAGHPHSIARDPQFVSLFGPQVAETMAIYTHHHDHRHDSAGAPVPFERTRKKTTRPRPRRGATTSSSLPRDS